MWKEKIGGEMKINADFPGGNIIVDKQDGRNIYIHQDLRDTKGNWFYWSFEVESPDEGKYNFIFTESKAVGVLGPAVSYDDGRTWEWGKSLDYSFNHFTYNFTGKERSVRFGMSMNYTESNLKKFVSKYIGNPFFKYGELTKTRKGRMVDVITVGDICNSDVIVLTARSHCCEMMASYVLEGIIDQILEHNEAFLKNHAFLIVPFLDKDGVEEGDQGKNRLPHDHNRDFGDNSIYPSVKALKQKISEIGCNRVVGYLDLHCPYIDGNQIYLVGSPDKFISAEQKKFSKLIAEEKSLNLPFNAEDFYPFGIGWNTGELKALTGAGWAAMKLPNIKISTTIEFPYALVKDVALSQKSSRQFGKILADVIVKYF